LPYAPNPQWTSGSGYFEWSDIEQAEYYYVVEKTAFSRYTGPTFNLTADKTDNIILYPIPVTIILTVEESRVSIGQNFKFHVHTDGLVPSFWVESKSRVAGNASVYYLKGFTAYTSDFDYTIPANSLYAGDWETTVNVGNYTSNAVSHTVSPLVTIPFEPVPQVNRTEFEQMGLTWVLPLLSPTFILTIVLAVICALLEKVAKSGGKVFIIIMIIGIFIFTLVGVYPYWVGIIFILFSAVIVATIFKGWIG
jgi:hypothetical protein